MLADALSTFAASRDIAPLQASIVEVHCAGWIERSKPIAASFRYVAPLMGFAFGSRHPTGQT
jgi:hypothetical protein